MFRNYCINWACNHGSDLIIQVLDEPCKADEASEHIVFEGCPWECLDKLNDDTLEKAFQTCYSYEGENAMGAEVRFLGVYLEEV